MGLGRGHCIGRCAVLNIGVVYSLFIFLMKHLFI